MERKDMLKKYGIADVTVEGLFVSIAGKAYTPADVNKMVKDGPRMFAYVNGFEKIMRDPVKAAENMIVANKNSRSQAITWADALHAAGGIWVVVTPRHVVAFGAKQLKENMLIAAGVFEGGVMSVLNSLKIAYAHKPLDEWRAPTKQQTEDVHEDRVLAVNALKNAIANAEKPKAPRQPRKRTATTTTTTEAPKTA